MRRSGSRSTYEAGDEKEEDEEEGEEELEEGDQRPLTQFLFHGFLVVF